VPDCAGLSVAPALTFSPFSPPSGAWTIFPRIEKKMVSQKKKSSDLMNLGKLSDPLWLEAPTSDSACRLGMGFHAARESAFLPCPGRFGLN